MGGAFCEIFSGVLIGDEARCCDCGFVGVEGICAKRCFGVEPASIGFNPGPIVMPIDHCPFLAEVQVAFEAAKEAGILCARIRKNFDLSVQKKSDSSPITRKS